MTRTDTQTDTTEPKTRRKPTGSRAPRTTAATRKRKEAGAALPQATVDYGSRLTDNDLYLFNEGTHGRLHEVLGAHPATAAGQTGSFFGVWAPSAHGVSVIGDFNDWKPAPLRPRNSSGIWEGFLPGAKPGDRYKYRIQTPHGYDVDKSDPVGFRHEPHPGHASLVTDLSYDWNDGDWMGTRRERNALDAPMSVYEVHLGSWRRKPEEGHRMLTYRELAAPLADHAEDAGFTHVQLMPVMEHPFYGSWGYQTTGYFAPTHRHGDPQGLMHLIDHLHQRDVGVLLDWVPSHFPDDPHGLGRFDGTHLYEHMDPQLGFHPDWKSLVFNYGRHEVRSFLLSSALYWLDRYHADGLRVDGVASMLYLDYSRKQGEWIPNKYGGRENLEAIHFLRTLNEHVYREHPDVQTIAEESTAWPMVSRPTYLGGLGFGMKWDMGWMHDTLRYMARDPVHRSHHHWELSFRMLYAFQENFMLPLSHDEVVHGKGSLLGKMPGDDWQRFANLRLLYGYQWTQPGKKLLFMGCEFAQHWEWDHDHSLPWHLLESELHAGVLHLVRDLNRLHLEEPSLHKLDFDPSGFEWVDASDAGNSVLSYLRLGGDPLLVVLNLTPVVRHHHRIGVPVGGHWDEVLNTDATRYGGSGVGNPGGADADTTPAHGRPHSVELTLPPLGVLVLRATGAGAGGSDAGGPDAAGSGGGTNRGGGRRA